MYKFFAIFFLFFFVAMFVRFTLFGANDSLMFDQLIFHDKILAILGLIGFFGFWLLMLADFFNNQQLEHKTIWGFSLIFFSWLAALIYFIAHFLPRHKIKLSGRKMGSPISRP